MVYSSLTWQWSVAVAQCAVVVFGVVLLANYAVTLWHARRKSLRA
ncbi:MAG TPA: hypothetical protein VGJ15_12585 [Pirellulales bacterium]